MDSRGALRKGEHWYCDILAVYSRESGVCLCEVTLFRTVAALPKRPHFASCFRQMIKSFADTETEKVFHRQFSRKLPGDIQSVALRKLRMLNNAHGVNDLRVPPANRLERLSRTSEGQNSIRINDQWRVCITWGKGDVHDVEIVDYH